MTKGLLICSLIIVALIAIIPIIAVITIFKNSKENDLLKKVVTSIFTINVISLILLISLWITPIKNNELYFYEDENISENITLETSGFKKLSISEYLELIKSNEKSIILVARPTCGYCEQFSPILKEAADDMKLTINYVNTDEFTNDDWNTFNSSLEYLNTEDWGTPLTLIVQNGNVVADNNGYVELDQIKAFFKENGLGE